MDTPELRHVASLITAALVTHQEFATPDKAARLYFRCLDALVSAAKEHEAEKADIAAKSDSQRNS